MARHRSHLVGLVMGLIAQGCQDTEADPPPSDTTDVVRDTILPDTVLPDAVLPDVPPSMFTTGICQKDWCWEQPLPFGYRLPWPGGFWSESADEAWAVPAEGGPLVHWEGQRWDLVEGEFHVPLDGSDTDNLVVATADGAMHFDGAAWRPMAGCPRPHTLWVAGPDEVWMATEERQPDRDLRNVTLYRWNGSSCMAYETFENAEAPRLDGTRKIRQGGATDPADANGETNPIDGSPALGWLALRLRENPPPSDVSGRLLKWDGNAWTVVLDTESIGALKAVSPDLAWMSVQTWLWKWDGTRWSQTSHENVAHLTFASPTDGWATTGHGAGASRSGSVLRWDGTDWTSVLSVPNYPVHLYAASPDDVFVALEGGQGMHWNGDDWTPNVPDTESLDLVDIAVGPTGEVWAISEGALLKRSGGDSPTSGLGGARWGLVEAKGGTTVWSGVEGQAWVGTSAGLARWDGEWHPVALPEGVVGGVIAIWGATPDAVFVATDRTVSRWNGSGWAWSRPAPGVLGTLKSVLGSGPDDVWALGAWGLARVTEDGWEVVDLPRCSSVSYGTGVVGEFDTFWIDSPGHPVILGHGSYEAGDVVLEAMTITEPGAEGWTCDVVNEDNHTTRVAACDGEVWMTMGGSLGRLDGRRWVTSWLGTTQTAIACAPGRGFWFAGQGGVIAHRSPAHNP